MISVQIGSADSAGCSAFRNTNLKPKRGFFGAARPTRRKEDLSGPFRDLAEFTRFLDVHLRVGVARSCAFGGGWATPSPSPHRMSILRSLLAPPQPPCARRHPVAPRNQIFWAEAMNGPQSRKRTPVPSVPLSGGGNTRAGRSLPARASRGQRSLLFLAHPGSARPRMCVRHRALPWPPRHVFASGGPWRGLVAMSVRVRRVASSPRPVTAVLWANRASPIFGHDSCCWGAHAPSSATPPAPTPAIYSGTHAQHPSAPGARHYRVHGSHFLRVQRHATAHFGSVFVVCISEKGAGVPAQHRFPVAWSGRTALCMPVRGRSLLGALQHLHRGPEKHSYTPPPPGLLLQCFHSSPNPNTPSPLLAQALAMLRTRAAASAAPPMTAPEGWAAQRLAAYREASDVPNAEARALEGATLWCGAA